MAKKKTALRTYSVPTEMTFRGVVDVEANSPEEAEAQVSAGYYDEDFLIRASRSDYEVVGPAREMSDA